MKRMGTAVTAIIALLIVIVIYSFAYVVKEVDQVVITQFGEPVGDPITDPGIHFKIPLIQKANFFEKRFLEWDGDREQVPTKDRRFIWVDTYARWRIDNALLFLQRVTNERGAQTRLDDILDSETKSAIARYDLIELIRTSNREPIKTDDITEQLGNAEFAQIDVGREQITREIIEAAAPKLKELGIELLDLRFKRIKFLDEVQQRIFERMIAERKRIAERFRSEGQGEASRILGNKERDLLEIQSKAYRTAQEIKGRADAEATAIFARAYDRNAETRDFYRFLKSMEAYESTITEKDWVLLSTKSDFFRFLRNQSGR